MPPHDTAQRRLRHLFNTGPIAFLCLLTPQVQSCVGSLDQLSSFGCREYRRRHRGAISRTSLWFGVGVAGSVLSPLYYASS